jgi:preprotein translocase subunit SecE
MAFSFKGNWLGNYVTESREELKKVTWPSRQEVVRDTMLVIGISVALGAFFGLVDFGLSKGLAALLAA